MIGERYAWLASIALVILLTGTARLWQPSWGAMLVAFHATAARAFKPECACRVTDLRVEPAATGNRLRLTAMLSRTGDRTPSVVIRSRLPVAASQHAFIALLAVMLGWPARSGSEMLRRLFALPCAIIMLELATTTAQLVAPLESLSAQLELRNASDWLTYWSSFLESGGRLAVAILVALLAIAAAQVRAQPVARAAAAP